MGKSRKYGFEFTDKKDYWKKYHKIHYKQNKETYKENFIKWKNKNPDKWKEIKRKSNNIRQTKKIEFLGNKCECCKCEDIRVLQFHHRNGRKKKDSTYATWEEIKSGGIKLLCANCHIIKHWEKDN